MNKEDKQLSRSLLARASVSPKICATLSVALRSSPLAQVPVSLKPTHKSCILGCDTSPLSGPGVSPTSVGCGRRPHRQSENNDEACLLEYCQVSLLARAAALAALIFASVARAAASFRSDLDAPPLAPNLPITSATDASATGGGGGGGGACTTGSKKRPPRPAKFGVPLPPFSAHSATFVRPIERSVLSGGRSGQTSLAAFRNRSSADLAANAVAERLFNFEGDMRSRNRVGRRETSDGHLFTQSYARP
jgi:hypothetical protein